MTNQVFTSTTRTAESDARVEAAITARRAAHGLPPRTAAEIAKARDWIALGQRQMARTSPRRWTGAI